jgi:hypothetical protein
MDNILSYKDHERIIQMMKNTTSSNLEFEIRIGYYIENFFKSDIDFDKYTKILNMSELYFDDEINTETMLVCKSKENSQKIITYKNDLPTKTVYRKKNRVSMLNLPLYASRIALSDEIELKSSNEIFDDCFRFKDRVSKISKNKLWRYDFTKVYDLNIKNENIKDIKKVLSNSKYHYELEIEYIGNIKNIIISQIISILFMIRKNEINNNKHILKQIQSLFSDKYEFNTKFKRVAPHMINFKQITNHLVGLTSLNIQNIFSNYAVTEKADGENNFIYINIDGIYLINDRANVTKLDLKLQDISLVNTLINGEYVQYLNSFYTFDILIFKGKEITQLHLPDRLKCINEIQNNIKSSESFKLYTKKYYMSNMIESSDKIYNKTKFPYSIDGLVYTAINQGFRTVGYKWKPLNEVTSDFLVKKSPIQDEFYLYVTINKDDLRKYNLSVDDDHDKLFPMFPKNGFYFPIKFQMPNEKKKTYIVKDSTLKDNTIIEFSYNNKWIKLRERVDKTENYEKSMRIGRFFGPNAFVVAYDNWMSLHNDPITTEIITGKEPLPKSVKLSRAYFTGKSKKDSKLRFMNIFHSVVIKKNLYIDFIQKPQLINNVLEMSGGRGADMQKWLQINIKNLTVHDIDEVALTEAKRRLDEMKNKTNYKMNVKFVQGDLRQDIHYKFGKEKYDAISMQFAIHYMLGNQISLKNLIKTIKFNLKKGGYFIFTTFDGQLVFDLLSKNSIQFNESYDFKIDDEKVLGIKRLYKENTFEKLGQEISVFVDTIGEHAGEFLVDFNYLLEVFVKNGFELVQSEYFKNIMDNWEDKSKMKESEIAFSSLYRYMVVKKL